MDPAAYPGALQPAVSPSAAGRDILAEACQAAGRLGLPVSAWAVLLHRDDLDDSPAEVQQNCFGSACAGAGARHGADVPALAARCRAYLAGAFDASVPATLRDKAAAARAHDCAELNFCAYGLYRLQALDKIRQALSPPALTHLASFAFDHPPSRAEVRALSLP